MPDRIIADLLSRLTVRRRLFGGAFGMLAGSLPSFAEASRQGKRRKKQKKRWARQIARRKRRIGRQYEADCLQEEHGNVCPDEVRACCHHLRDLDVDGYCWCLLLETCGSCCVGYPGCDD